MILYVIAWSVTDVKLNRLVERFDDARKVGVKLVNPDFVTIYINGEDQVCDWSCLVAYVKDRQAGRQPAGPIRISDNLLDILGRVKQQPAPRWMVQLGWRRTAAGPYICGRHVDPNHRHRPAGDDFLHHPGHPGQLFGRPQHHGACAGRDGDLLRRRAAS